MKTVAKYTAFVGIIAIGIFAVAITCYGLYQQSQLYPSLHQQIGYSQCEIDVNAYFAEQQALNQPANE